jgi:AraC family transcriptional regulator
MLKAANALKDNSVTITDIALQAGFSSSQAFAKVIKRELGTTASNLRADPEQLSSILLKLNAPLNPENPQASPFEVRLTSLAPFQMVAVSTDNRYPNLNELYAQLFELAGGPENVAAILGLAYGDIESGEKEQSRFDCGVLLRKIPDTLPEPFIVQPNPKQRYAVLRHQGSYQDLAKIIDDLYLVTLRDDQKLPADKPCLLHYLDDPELTEENALRTDIYLPVNEILS